MATGRLPEHEQRILDQMEEELRGDRRFSRRLRKLGVRRRLGLTFLTRLTRPADHRPRTGTVVFSVLVSVSLLVAGICTSEPAVIWAFAGVWPLTLFGVLRLLRRRAAPPRQRW